MGLQQTRVTRDTGVAIERLLAGEVVALPTETVYGLAGDATDATAVARIYEAKTRPSFNPLIAHVPDAEAALAQVDLHPLLQTLADAFWPGPLTLLGPVRADATIAPLCRSGLAVQAVRVPAHPLMQQVLRGVGRPLAAPSANASGRISPTRPDHVLASLAGRIPLLLDGGACSLGLESTVVGMDGPDPVILRSGALTAEALAGVLGMLPRAAGSAGITSPGQFASHYAPAKPLLLDQTECQAGMYLVGFGPVAGDDSLSRSGDLVEAAACLFNCLYRADASDAACIGVAPVPHYGLGVAINDRLSRAAVR